MSDPGQTMSASLKASTPIPLHPADFCGFANSTCDYWNGSIEHSEAIYPILFARSEIPG
jgi:hypothetical protein